MPKDVFDFPSRAQ
jgi:hypothetical protein